MWESKEEAVNAPKGKLDLVYCRNCNHVFNKAFDPSLMEYTQSYENSLHFSPKFQEYADSLTAHLVSRYNLYSKTIIDIGCGKGDFLKQICELGKNKGYGFDPSYEPEEGSEDKTDVTFVLDFYSDKYADYKADLITCRHVLEHIQYPVEFIKNVRKSIGDNKSAVFFEVPNVNYTIEDFGIWDLIYEHCSYFSRDSLSYLFSSSGFGIEKIDKYFKGQFLGIETYPVNNGNNNFEVSESNKKSFSELADQFSEKFKVKLNEWSNIISKLSAENKKIVIWGGGSKGVTFMNMLGDKNPIEYVIDINPRKEGMFAAGTGQKYVMPQFLNSYKPDVVIIMNSIYETEIKSALQEHGVNAEILIA
jgi:2-polyprenyl-3-methyl-5-hydroxy-6-metoxy-1,4-benzoquinol methylase